MRRCVGIKNDVNLIKKTSRMIQGWNNTQAPNNVKLSLQSSIPTQNIKGEKKNLDLLHPSILASFKSNFKGC